MADIKGQIAQTEVNRDSEGTNKLFRLMRDGSLGTMDWKQSFVFEGKAYMMQIGTEDAPVASTTSIDAELVMGVIDVPDGAVVIPVWAQYVVGTWTSAALINFMLEVDNAQVRYSSGGTAWTPLNLHTGMANGSACTCYVGTDVTVGDKTSGGSLEIYRESMEVNLGDTADYWPKMEYIPQASPVVKGPGSIVIHAGATADVTGYTNIMWLELNKDDV